MQNLPWIFGDFSIFFIFLHDVWRRRSPERSSLSHPQTTFNVHQRPAGVVEPKSDRGQDHVEWPGLNPWVTWIGWLVWGARGSAASSKLSKTADIRAWRQGLEWLEWVRGCTKPNFLTLLSQCVSCCCLIFSLHQVVPSFEMPLMEISKRLEVESTHVHSVV